MAAAAASILEQHLRAGLVVAPTAGPLPTPLRLVVAEHPHPGEGSLRAGQEALALARESAGDERLLVLLSGGASALLVAPAAGLAFEDKRNTTARLLRAGASIHELNTVRKQLSAIKGGRLALASAAVVHTLALSDVVGDDLSVIGSGPTVPDRSTKADALVVLERFGGLADYPPPVVAFLSHPENDTAEVARRRAESRGDTARVIGGRREAMQGAAEKARALGYAVVVIDEPRVGEARIAGPEVVEMAVRSARGKEPCCVVSSGETTVNVRGNGRGGRNQELALAAVSCLAGDRPVALASIGTDGIDGPTDAAGAIADSSSAPRAIAAGLALPDTFLQDNDAYRFFEALGDLVITGPTGTNVGDLQVVLLA